MIRKASFRSSRWWNCGEQVSDDGDGDGDDDDDGDGDGDATNIWRKNLMQLQM